MPTNVSTLIQSSLLGASGATGATGPAGATGATGATGPTYSRSGVPGLIGGSGARPSGQFILTAAGAWPSDASGASFPTQTELSSGLNYYYISFPSGLKRYCNWACQFPNDFPGGVGFNMQSTFLWTHASGSSGNNVVWEIEARSINDNETMNPASPFGTAKSVTDTSVSGANYLYVSPTTSTLVPAGTANRYEYIHFRVNRTGSGVLDTAPYDARLLGVIVHYDLSSTQAIPRP